MFAISKQNISQVKYLKPITFAEDLGIRKSKIKIIHKHFTIKYVSNTIYPLVTTEPEILVMFS